MRTNLTAAVFCLLAFSAVGAHHASAVLGPILPAARAEPHDPFSSAAALRHRMARPPHWIAHMLVPRPVR
jgi:hypothetical protein